MMRARLMWGALGLLAAVGCDGSRPRSMVDGVDGGPRVDAGLDEGAPAARDMGLDGAVDAEAPGESVVLVAARRVAEGDRVLLEVDPRSGDARPWGEPLPLAAEWPLNEVHHDATRSRVIVRYEVPPPLGTRRTNFSHAGYLAAERGGPWREVAYAEVSIGLRIAPDLSRLALATRALDDSACPDNRVLSFDGEVLVDYAAASLACDAQPMVAGFLAGDAGLLLWDGDRVAIERLDGARVHLDLGESPARGRPVALDGAAVLVQSPDAGWYGFDGEPVGAGPIALGRLFGGYTVVDGMLSALEVDAGAPRPAPFAGGVYSSPPHPDRPDLEGDLERLWPDVVGGVWVGAVATHSYFEQPEPDADPQVYRLAESWWVGADGAVVRAPLWDRQPDGLWIDRDAAVWVERCRLVRVDRRTGARADVPLPGYELLDVRVGQPGFWGGLPDGSGQRQANHAGFARFDTRHFPLTSAACEAR